LPVVLPSVLPSVLPGDDITALMRIDEVKRPAGDPSPRKASLPSAQGGRNKRYGSYKRIAQGAGDVKDSNRAGGVRCQWSVVSGP